MNNCTSVLRTLVPQIRELIVSAQRTALHTINTLQVATNYKIGRLIIEHEQEGAERARYGESLLRKLSASLTKEFGKGFSLSNLKYMRRFYLIYRDRTHQIGQTVSGQLAKSLKSQTVSGKLKHPLLLSWSHYVFLLSVDNPDERNFYEIEAAAQGWSLRELKRQFASSLYERLALSRDKDEVLKLSTKGQIIDRPRDLLKNPYVLEFLGLDEKATYSETNLETAIIDKLEHFLLELGKGFLFEARQKRFAFDEEHFFVDLVFYNRLLRCYVLIDFKIGKLIHHDLGQMQMYVNYFNRHVKAQDENSTIGILLCHSKNDALVELTLPEDAQIYASEYQLYLPSKEELKRKLMAWAEEADA